MIHLHVHTEYSLLDGAIKTKKLIDKAKSLGMEAVAITDHGTMFGALNFYLEAKKSGINPIVGVETYLTEDIADKRKRTSRHHLVLLAMNFEGYQNLLKICSIGYLEGFYHKPRCDKAILRKYNAGLICLSGCLAGEISQQIMDGVDDQIIVKTIDEYKEIFGDRFYLEVQANEIKEQTEVNEKIHALGVLTSTPLVVTNDCHYLDKEDKIAHDILLCIQTKKLFADKNRMKSEGSLHFKSEEEIRAWLDYSWIDDAIKNTHAIGRRCHLEIPTSGYHFPSYELPANTTMESEFIRRCKTGLARRLESPDNANVNRQEYAERLDYEIKTILSMGFPDYFLIVEDFISWAKQRSIMVGPGRGSAAGSLVAWSLGITDLDPIPYNLLFERFLNSERVSMPDIDIDFCEERRSEVVEYVVQKYGTEMVASITTFGTMKAKAALKDVGRALGIEFETMNNLVRELNATDSIRQSYEGNEYFRGSVANDRSLKNVVFVGDRLEGLSRHASTHACGILIADKPIVEYCPLYRDKEGSTVTQYDGKGVEKLGLLKFDFLGLRTLTLIRKALENIGKNNKPIPVLETGKFSDTLVYKKIFQKGDTDGVFQLESYGMKKYLKMLKPELFEDIIAMLALYRPGPLGSGMVDEFIERKHGHKKVEYLLPCLEPVLNNTYGVIVYQEQVMQIAQVVAGYSLGQADLLRRAMGKKNPEEMAKQSSVFISGAIANGVSEEIAKELFDLMEKFAEYGFNKSHSAAYAVLSYQTAFLKAHYPTEFMAALLTTEHKNQENIKQYINSTKFMGLKINCPSINKIEADYCSESGGVNIGLSGISGMGDESIREIIDTRKNSGSYKSLYDFITRVNTQKVNKSIVQSLIYAGCMDCFDSDRDKLISSLSSIYALSAKNGSNIKQKIALLPFLSNSINQVSNGIGIDCSNLEIIKTDDAFKASKELEILGIMLSKNAKSVNNQHNIFS